MRALSFEVFYDGMTSPSISVPALDFFGLPLGRPVEFASILSAVQEGRGFNSYAPMPIRKSARLELSNHSDRMMSFYYQIDYTRDEQADEGVGLLHVGWRRENPTALREDFTIVDGLAGPGRFLGCNVGIRVIDAGDWYGEGEVKVFLDGDTTHPTICGTGLEDYVGSAWGMGAHVAPYAGSPLEVRASESESQPDFLSFYRWHLLGPIVFRDDLRVTIQKIGAVAFAAGQGEAFDAYATTPRRQGAVGSCNPQARCTPGHRRARRRLLRHVVRLLPNGPGGTPPRHRRGVSRYWGASVRTAVAKRAAPGCIDAPRIGGRGVTGEGGFAQETRGA